MAASLESMLLDAARLNVRIRQHYMAIKRDTAARYYTYVLLLQRNKIYVGSSDLLVQRLLEHRTMSRASAKWVREHGPVERVVEVAVNCGPEDEMYKTLEYMSLFGWQHVRGAFWCRPDMRAPPPALAWFERTQRFEYMPRAALDLLVSHVDELAAELNALSPAADGEADAEGDSSAGSAASAASGD